MLVLSRSVGQKIISGDDVVMTVIGIEGSQDGKQVRLGIEAPESVQILRKELLEKVANYPLKGALWR